MTYKMQRSSVKAIRQGDPLFTIADGGIVYQRAGFHILPDCPNTYREVINESIQRGWLKPVAYMTDREVVFETLAA